MEQLPKVAVILDENTSGDASRYEASKGYFSAIRDAGGLPFGIPYFPELVATVVADFDALLCVGGRFAYPDNWYIEGTESNAPPSERFPVEHQIINAFLKLDKPVLGICAGMQLLACVNRCRLLSDVQSLGPNTLNHDNPAELHQVTLVADTQLHTLVAESTMIVNSRHREAIGELSDSVVVSAYASDGVIEAIEVPAYKFAIGLQWHQEKFATKDHPGNAVFRGLIEACM